MSSNFLDTPLKGGGSTLFYQYSLRCFIGTAYAVLSVQHLCCFISTASMLFVPGLSRYLFHSPGILSWFV